MNFKGPFQLKLFHAAMVLTEAEFPRDGRVITGFALVVQAQQKSANYLF